MKLKVSQENFKEEKGNMLTKLKDKLETLGDLSKHRQSLIEKDDTHDKRADADLRLFRESVKSDDFLSQYVLSPKEMKEKAF